MPDKHREMGPQIPGIHPSDMPDPEFDSLQESLILLVDPEFYHQVYLKTKAGNEPDFVSDSDWFSLTMAVIHNDTLDKEIKHKLYEKVSRLRLLPRLRRNAARRYSD